MISNQRDLEAFQRADLWYSCQQERWRAVYYLTRRALYYQRVLRRGEYWEARSGQPIGRLILAFYKFRLARLGERVGVSIPRGTCGPGLSIAHPGTIVVNGDARLGARCRLSQGVTIGASPAGAPVIGDDVFFGPNSQAIGPVVIGEGATVLPGAVVTRDVAARTTVGGVPARVTCSDSSPWHTTLLPIGSPASGRPE